MAFFKFRKGADESPRASAQPPSIEAIRQRAKYRLAGATVLVLVGVIGLPLLFDKQPRPIAVDTPIVIPDKNKVSPLAMPRAPEPVAAADPASSQAPASPAKTEVVITPPVVADKKPDENKSPAPVEKAVLATNKVASATPAETRTPASAAPAAVPKVQDVKPDANRAQALLDGKDAASIKTTAAKTPVAKPAAPAAAPAKPAAVEGRFVVQVGAFSDNTRAHEVRLKLEHAGLKTYAQSVDTKDGKRIRVRLGPFATKVEAEKAVEKVKKLSLPASLLTL